uniref:ATP-binding protein n=1 Tax=Segatella copri TaxID=165179 RepID=UPI003FEDED77
MATKLYPIGMQTFSEIREEDFLYVDKTEYIYRMTHTSGKYFFLSRPRRFGKSLLVSTMQSYFEGKKELFKGLAIDKLEKEWTEYPVLHFDMSGGKHMEPEQLELYLGYILEDQEKKWGINEPRIGANNRLIDLINTAYEKSGKQVVVLIDEYDAPMLDVAHEKEHLDVLRNIMRNFFSPLKYSEAKLRFVFLTGITKFSQVSIFSELNNITNVSMDDEYAGICGITKEELLENMSDDIDMLADALGYSREMMIAKLKENYDGYHFSKKSPDVFNPYSLLNCFSKKELGAFWFSSGTPTYLINMLRQFGVLPTEIAPTEAVNSSFNAPTENMKTITPLLYQSGYVTIKEYDQETRIYTLDIPNKEIKVGLFDNLLPNYVDGVSAERGNVAIAKMALLIGKRNMDGALHLLQDFLGTVPYCNVTNYEGHYQQMLFIIFTLLTNYLVDVEVHTPRGRVDIVLLTKTDLYVVELKLNKSAQAAMQQINLKNYRQRFALCGLPITKVGINFDSTQGTIEDWVIEA